MLFADDIVLIDEMLGGVNTRPQVWRQFLESKDFKSKKFDDMSYEADVDMKLDTSIIPKREKFKYLGSVIKVMGRLTRMLLIVLRWDG